MKNWGSRGEKEKERTRQSIFRTIIYIHKMYKNRTIYGEHYRKSNGSQALRIVPRVLLDRVRHHILCVVIENRVNFEEKRWVTIS